MTRYKIKNKETQFTDKIKKRNKPEDKDIRERK